jgi:acyl-CoA thioesterase-2
MSTLDEVLDILDVRQTGDGRFVGDNMLDGAGQVVFGGQLLAQSIIAASKALPGKQVLSMHTVFTRGAALDAPVELEVETLHSGRAFASASVSVLQGDRLCLRSTVLLHAPDEDLIRHQATAPAVDPPEAFAPLDHADWWDVRVVGDVDLRDPTLTGPPELRVWSRVPGAPEDPAINQALLAHATDGFLIGTAMRPHPGIGQALAHVSVSTTVLAHTLTFHEPVAVDGWHLLDQRSTAAGHGRSHGVGEIYTQVGRLVCSFSQENVIRSMPEGSRSSAGRPSKY